MAKVHLHCDFCGQDYTEARDYHSCPDAVGAALRDIRSLAAFAYERGFHEMGYDPVTVIENAVRAAPSATEQRT